MWTVIPCLWNGKKVFGFCAVCNIVPHPLATELNQTKSADFCYCLFHTIISQMGEKTREKEERSLLHTRTHTLLPPPKREHRISIFFFNKKCIIILFHIECNSCAVYKLVLSVVWCRFNRKPLKWHQTADCTFVWWRCLQKFIHPTRRVCIVCNSDLDFFLFAIFVYVEKRTDFVRFFWSANVQTKLTESLCKPTPTISNIEWWKLLLNFIYLNFRLLILVNFVLFFFLSVSLSIYLSICFSISKKRKPLIN